jgi:hypothetical protein
MTIADVQAYAMPKRGACALYVALRHEDAVQGVLDRAIDLAGCKEVEFIPTPTHASWSLTVRPAYVLSVAQSIYMLLQAASFGLRFYVPNPTGAPLEVAMQQWVDAVIRKG